MSDLNAGSAVGRTETATSSSLRLVLADDNPTTGRLIVDYLSMKGWDVVHVTDGLQALEAVQASPPDVLLLDIQMPGLDGFAVLEAIRNAPSAAVRQLRVITLTAMAMRGDEERCLAMGANAYCAKPVRLRDLVRLVEAEAAASRASSAADGRQPHA